MKRDPWQLFFSKFTTNLVSEVILKACQYRSSYECMKAIVCVLV